MSTALQLPSGAGTALAHPAGAPGQYLTFMVGAEMFAIGILAIKEIIEYAGVTVVPMMPPFVRGVINLRGAVVPVVDALARFGRGQAAITSRSCIIIVEALRAADGDEPAARQVVGVMVDAVNAVLEIGAEGIEPAPAFGARIRSDFVAGMGKLSGKHEGKFVILLNIDAVLATEDAMGGTALGGTPLGGGAAQAGLAAPSQPALSQSALSH